MLWQECRVQVLDPLNSPLLDEMSLAWIARNQIKRVCPETIETLDGAVGGGIVIEHRRTPFPGLASCVLDTFAEQVSAPGSDTRGNHGVCSVTYLEPSRAIYDPSVERRPRVYADCEVTYEHAQAAGEAMFWLVDFTAAKKEIAGIDNLPELGRGFGLEVQRLGEAPRPLAEETRSWFVEEDHEFVWFQVQGRRDGIGFNYAIVVYCALYLCKEAGHRFKRMHVISQLESKTQLRLQRAERARKDRAWRIREPPKPPHLGRS